MEIKKPKPNPLEHLVPISEEGAVAIKYVLPPERDQKADLAEHIHAMGYAHFIDLRYASELPGTPGGYSPDDIKLLSDHFGRNNVIVIPEAGALPDPQDPSNPTMLNPVEGGIAVFVKRPDEPT